MNAQNIQTKIEREYETTKNMVLSCMYTLWRIIKYDINENDCYQLDMPRYIRDRRFENSLQRNIDELHKTCTQN